MRSDTRGVSSLYVLSRTMPETTLDTRPAAQALLSIREHVHGLAIAHGVVYEETALDQLANAHARLSDNDVTLDETERLIIALRRAGVVTDEEGSRLHDAYIRGDLGLS